MTLEVGEIVSGHDGFELSAQTVGQTAAFGAKFKAHVGDTARFIDFNVYKYAVHDLSDDVVGDKI